MRILIVSKEVWRDDQNGGNTLSSIFSAFPEDIEFAQIFCSEGNPDNNVCTKYFKMSTSDIVRAIKGRSEAGCEISIDKATVETISNIGTDVVAIGLIHKLKRITNNEAFREIVWKSGKYKSEKLKKFIMDYNPDVIFAPGYGVYYMNSLTIWIFSFVNCPIVSLISDDYYTYSIRSLNPFWWINLFFLREKVRKTVRCYDLIYTMTEAQKRQIEKDYGKPVKILIKGTNVEKLGFSTEIHEPIRLVYAGNLALNRWKTLKYLAIELDKKNLTCENGKKNNSVERAFELDVYSNNAVDKKIISEFAGISSVTLHNGVSYDEIMNIYKNSDIALHVESFDLLNRDKVKMSFSTKIIDCLASGCAVMCICDKNQGGYEYLSNNELAICIDYPSKISTALDDIINNPDVINEYRKKAYDFVIENHDIKMVKEKLICDFENLM